MRLRKGGTRFSLGRVTCSQSMDSQSELSWTEGALREGPPFRILCGRGFDYYILNCLKSDSSADDVEISTYLNSVGILG